MKRAYGGTFSLIRIPSISALPEHKDDMLACALRWKELCWQPEQTKPW